MSKAKRQLKLLKHSKLDEVTRQNLFGLKSSWPKWRSLFWNFNGRGDQTSHKTVKLISWITGLICLAVGVFATFQIPHLSTSYSIKQFFPKGHPLFKKAEEIRQTFFLEENPGFLILLKKPAQKNWLQPSQIETLQKISSELQSFPELRSVQSLSTTEGLFETENQLTIGPIFENVPSAQWKNYVRQQPLISKQLINKNFRSTLILAEPMNLSPEELVSLSHKISKTIKSVDSDVQIEIGGVPAIQGQFAKKLLDELKIYLALCFVIFCIVFSFLLRGKGALFLVFINLFVSNLVALGVLSYLGISFSVLLTTLPILLSIVVVSLSVHCLHLWAERLEWLKKSKQSFTLSSRFSYSISVLKDLALPNFLGSLTTAIGFLSLATSPVPIIQEYGIAVSVSVMAGWAITHFFLFGFMVYVTPRLASHGDQKSFWALKSLSHNKPVFGMITLATLALAGVGTQIEFSSRLFDDLPKNETARKVTENVDQNFGGTVSYDLILNDSRDGFSFKSSKNIFKLSQLLKKIETLPAIGSAFSFTDFIDSKIYPHEEKLAETFFLYSLSPTNPLRNYITEDGKTLRFGVRFKDLPGQRIKNEREKIVKWVQHSFPSAQVTEAGLAVRAHTINEEVSRSLILGFLESLCFIGLFLVFVFRSFRWALVACLPNLIPPAVLLGCLALFETPIKPTIALIFSIALGLAFNNTVYILSRLKKMCGKNPPGVHQLRQALLQEGYPCLSETLLMFFGFMIFLSSSFQVNQTFGVYMLLSIISGFVGDLLFLPVLLKTFPSLLGSRSSGVSKDESQPYKKIAAIFAFTFMSFAFFGAKTEATVTDDVKALLKKVQSKVEAKDDQAHVQMVIIEPNGQKKEREMELYTMRDDQFYARVKILSPADVKNTGFLAHVSKDDEQHWIYVPSTKKVRRVVGGNKNAGILGSELTIEDLDPSALRASQAKILSKDKKKIVVEVQPTPGTSPYSKVLTAISASEYVPIRTLYYEGKKKVKSVDFQNYKKVSEKIWRAQKIKVQNYKNKRKTDLILTNMKTNKGLSKDQFSQNALKFD